VSESGSVRSSSVDKTEKSYLNVIVVTIVGSNFLIFSEEWQDMKIQLIDVLNYLDRSQTILGLNVFMNGKREQLGKFDNIRENVWMYNLEHRFEMD
jgi:hypothetical protein